MRPEMLPPDYPEELQLPETLPTDYPEEGAGNTTRLCRLIDCSKKTTANGKKKSVLVSSGDRRFYP